MSALFNQTNIAPGTGFASGGSNFPDGLTISNGGADPETLSIAGNIVWGRPVLTVSGSTQYLGTGDLVAGTFYAAAQSTPSGNSYFTGNYGANTIQYQGNLGTGSNTVLLNVIDTQLGLAANTAFSLNGISSMTAGTYTANMPKLISTMISLGYA